MFKKKWDIRKEKKINARSVNIKKGGEGWDLGGGGGGGGICIFAF